jgi:AcrR family transcriptional regulator
MVKIQTVGKKGVAGRRALVKRALIDAAERAIARDGLGGLRARALAQEAGCAVGAIYNVVEDLDDLVLAVNSRTLAALEERLQAAGAATDDDGPPAERAIRRLVRLAFAYLEFASSQKARWRTLFGHRMQEGREVPDWYRQDQQRLFGYVEELLRELTDSSPDKRALLARTLFSAVHGMVVLGLEEKLQLLPAPMLREQLALVVTAAARGLVPPG